MIVVVMAVRAQMKLEFSLVNNLVTNYQQKPYWLT